MEVTTALEQARELVRNGWCQMSAAKTSDGSEVYAASELADVFCMSGALMRVTWPWDDLDDGHLWEVTQECFELLARAIRESGVEDDRPPWHVISDWNDDPARTKWEVVELYDRAISLVKGERWR